MKKLITFVALAIFALAAQAQIPSGTVAAYSFNTGTANDDFGTNHGTLNGAILTSDRFGNPDKAAYFDGVNDYLDLGGSTDLKPQEGSISVWIKIAGISTSGTGFSYNPVFLIRNATTAINYMEGCGLYLSTVTSKILPITTNSGTSTEKYFSSTAAIPFDTWQHMVVTYSNDSLILFVNGEKNNKIAKGFTSTFNPTHPVYFGASKDSKNNRFFNGSIDDIRIFNKVLTTEEVKNLYADVDPTTTSIETFSKVQNSVTFYPNPTSGLVTFADAYNIVVTDVTGKTILKKSLANSIDISSQRAGFYFISFMNKKGEILKKSKIIKMN